MKMASYIRHALNFIKTFYNNTTNSFNNYFLPEYLAPAMINYPYSVQKKTVQPSLREIFDISTLLAVPKKRRSLEKRKSRRFGIPELHYKMLVPKTNILMCTKCGSFHEAGVLCPNCYSRVMAETKEMQEAIIKNLGLSPVEEEVVVLYQDDDKSKEYFKGKRIVEMDKPRPKIFCDNLLQKSTHKESHTNDVEIIPKIK